MPTDTAGIETIPGLGTVTYRLGWRQLGWRRWREIGRAVWGLAWSIAVAFWAHFWLWWLKEAAAVIGLWSVLPLILPSRAEVTVEADRVRWREAGWMKRGGGSIEKRDIRRLRVDAARHYQGGPKQWGGWARMGEAHLVAELADGQEAPLVAGYPRAVVVAMAELLREDLGQQEVVDLSDVPLAARDVDFPPARCPVVMHEVGDTRTFIYHRYGKAAMAARVTVVAVLVLLVSTLITAAIVSAGGGWPALVIVLALDALFIALGWKVLRDMWRTMVLVATPEGFTAAWRGVAGGRELHWPREQIVGMRVMAGTSGGSFRINSSKSSGQMWLVLLLRGGQFAWIIGGDTAVWAWVATQARRILGVDAGDIKDFD